MELTGRPKNLWGVHQKMCLKGHSLQDIYDVRAVRIIVDTKADCYTALQQVGGQVSVSDMACPGVHLMARQPAALHESIL